MEPARSIDGALVEAHERPLPRSRCPPVRLAGAPVGGLGMHKLQRVIGYVNEHLAERVALGTLAALVGLSQSHFSRAFKRSTGLSPYHFQLRARIRRAEELLLLEGASIASVAAATGFADQAHFTRTFRQMVGRTPGRFRRARAD